MKRKERKRGERMKEIICIMCFKPNRNDDLSLKNHIFIQLLPLTIAMWKII